MGAFERLARWLALRHYRSKLPRLLRERYGRERYFTPAQVLATIQVGRLNLRFAPYACAMFCTQRAYADFAAKQTGRPNPPFAPLENPTVPLWAGVLTESWPAHEDIVADLGPADGSSGADWNANFRGDLVGDAGGDFGDGAGGGDGGADGSH